MFRGVSRGAAGAKYTKLSRCKIFFALHLILGGKLHICGRDDLFFALQNRFLTMWLTVPVSFADSSTPFRGLIESADSGLKKHWSRPWFFKGGDFGLHRGDSNNCWNWRAILLLRGDFRIANTICNDLPKETLPSWRSFFWSAPEFNEKMKLCGRENLFFWSSSKFGGKITWTPSGCQGGNSMLHFPKRGDCAKKVEGPWILDLQATNRFESHD